MRVKTGTHSFVASAVVLAFAVIGTTAQASDLSNPSVNAERANNSRVFEFDGPHGTLDAPTAGIERMPVKGAVVKPTGIAGTITYRAGAPVMVDPKVYVIWYGSWGVNPCGQTGNTTPAVLGSFLHDISGSAWYNLNTSYYQDIAGTRTYVTPKVFYPVNGCIVNTGTLGKTLDTTTANATSKVVSAALTANALPTDANALYFVFTSSDISVSGFGTSFCGYHGYYSQGATPIKYSFVGDANKFGASCGVRATSPNSNPAADAMASVVAHELVEAVSDPLLNAWYDSAGNENADKCAWVYGTTTTLPSGALYNTFVGANKFLLQQNWIVNGNTCYTELPALSAPASNIAVTAGVAMTSTVPVLPIGGAPGYTYSIASTSPSTVTLASRGLILNPFTGAITGTPVGAGTFPFTITVKDSIPAPNARTVSSTFNIQITQQLSVTSLITTAKTLQIRTLVTPFPTVTATGGTGTLTYSITPALPSGLTLSPTTGFISGTPTATKSATTYTVKVKDSANVSKTATFSLIVK